MFPLTSTLFYVIFQLFQLKEYGMLAMFWEGPAYSMGWYTSEDIHTIMIVRQNSYNSGSFNYTFKFFDKLNDYI